MKKLLFSIAALVSCIAMSAQMKGDFAVGGIIGVNGKSSTLSATAAGRTESLRTPGNTEFTLNPMFSYFVINNLELSAGLNYEMAKTFSEEIDGTNYFDYTHLAMFQLGVHYFVPLVKDVLYYTPGFDLGLGGGSYVTNIEKNSKTSLKVPFALGFNINFAKFEVKVTKSVGLSFNLLDLNVSYARIDTGSSEVKAGVTGIGAGFNYGASVGARYYF